MKENTKNITKNIVAMLAFYLLIGLFLFLVILYCLAKWGVIGTVIGIIFGFCLYVFLMLDPDLPNNPDRRFIRKYIWRIKED